MRKIKKPLREQLWVRFLSSFHALYIAPLIITFIGSVVGVITNGFVKFFKMFWGYLSSLHEVNGALIIILIWGLATSVSLIISLLVLKFRKPEEIPARGYYRYSPSKDLDDVLVTWRNWHNTDSNSRKVTIDPKSLKFFCPSCGKEKEIEHSEMGIYEYQYLRCAQCNLNFTPSRVYNLYKEILLEMQKKLDVKFGMFDTKGLLK